MAEVPAGTATGAPDGSAPDGSAAEAKAATQVLAVAANSKRVDCLLFSWTCPA